MNAIDAIFNYDTLTVGISVFYDPTMTDWRVTMTDWLVVINLKWKECISESLFYWWYYLPKDSVFSVNY